MSNNRKQISRIIQKNIYRYRRINQFIPPITLFMWITIAIIS